MVNPPSSQLILVGIAALKGQEFTSSSTLGGQGVAQMIV